jgi:PhnB protein
MKLHPHLSIMFNGQCEAAFRFYERCLNGTLAYLLTWGDSPASSGVPPDWRTKIYHATLKVGDTEISGGDQPADRYEAPKGFSIVLDMDDPAAADRIFEALSENGRITMPLRETFWAARFGAVVDQFGLSWTINCESSDARRTGVPA